MMDWLRRRIRNRAGARQDGVTDEAPVKPGFSPKAKQQLIILAICRFAEPVALTSVFPYLYFMLKSFDIPSKDIAFWVGVTAASFSFSQFTSGVFWGRASDRYGRKPTILLGLLGTMFASIVFGLSKSPLQAITARCLSGLLNGNVGILRTAVAEIVPEEHLKPRAFSLMPLIWAIGSIFGPVIGGYLADPVKNYPEYFSPGGFFSTYPYALPNFFNAILFTIGTTVGFLFLEEPLEARKHDRDIGRELGCKIVSLFSRTKKTSRGDFGGHDETTPLINPNEEDAIPPPLAKPIPRKHAKPPALREAFTRQSSLNIVVYAFLALLSVSFDQMLPVYLSFPPMDHYPDSKNPLKFFGGFGLSSREIGSMLSTFGFLAMFFQFFIYPPVARHYGSLKCLQISLVMYPLACFLSPFAVIITEKYRRPFMYVLVFTKSFAGIFAFPCSTILLTRSAPSLRVLGTLNGIATAVAALGRAIGPTITGTVFSYGQKIEYLILPFWFMSTLSLLSLIPSFWLIEGESPKAEDTIEEQESDPSSSPQSTLISENSTRSPSPTHRN